MEHAGLQTFGPGYVPHGELDHLAQIRTASEAREREPTRGAFVPVKAPEGGGAALEDLDVDRVLTGRPLRHTHHNDRGGEAAGVRRHAVKNTLSRPHRRPPLPDHAGLLGHAHPAEVTQGQQARLLQGLRVREPQQDGNQTRDGASSE